MRLVRKYQLEHYFLRLLLVACSRRSDSRAQEQNSRKEKKRGETRGGKGEKMPFSRSRSPPVPPPVCPVYNLTRSPTYRRALLSERLEQAIYQRQDRHFTSSELRTRRSTHLQGKGSTFATLTFISQLSLDPKYWSGPGNRTRDLPLCSQALHRLS